MSQHNQRLGRWGEKVAATHLIASGYRIITRNWRCPLGEIDLVAVKHEIFHMIEVKTRRGRDHGGPEEAISSRKLKKMQECALLFLAEHDENDPSWAIDLIAVEIDHTGKLVRVDHMLVA